MNMVSPAKRADSSPVLFSLANFACILFVQEIIFKGIGRIIFFKNGFCFFQVFGNGICRIEFHVHYIKTQTLWARP